MVSSLCAASGDLVQGSDRGSAHRGDGVVAKDLTLRWAFVVRDVLYLFKCLLWSL